jgi:hypothetical protein
MFGSVGIRASSRPSTRMRTLRPGRASVISRSGRLTAAEKASETVVPVTKRFWTCIPTAVPQFSRTSSRMLYWDRIPGATASAKSSWAPAN